MKKILCVLNVNWMLMDYSSILILNYLDVNNDLCQSKPSSYGVQYITWQWSTSYHLDLGGGGRPVAKHIIYSDRNITEDKVPDGSKICPHVYMFSYTLQTCPSHKTYMFWRWYWCCIIILHVQIDHFQNSLTDVFSRL